MIIVMIRKNNGVWLLLSVWMILESKLKLMDVKIFNKIIEINVCVWLIILGGVCINWSIGWINRRFRMVKIIVMIRLIIILVVKFFFRFW